MSRLERWSRRKRGVEAPDEPDRDPVPLSSEHTSSEHAENAAAGEAQPDVAAEPEAPPGSLDHTLPDPDALPPGADFTAYLKQGVSSQLRRRALRCLWSSGNYGVRDGLDDYDENYREVLKPLARDVAEQLRRWTRPSEEAPMAPEAEEQEAEEQEALAEARPADAAECDDRDDTIAEARPRREAPAENRLDAEASGGDNKFSQS
ncbi:DUF3306 domain-containing protein [Halomonas sp. H10-9-1]|uniref:DUF3306 domain-containing protein n=1 Tax=Halomonas sp. H10-9-1 TaxID=2950871 RepID=UPI0032DED070